MDQEQIDRLTSAIGMIEDKLRFLEVKMNQHQHSGDDGSSALKNTKILLSSSDSIAADSSSPAGTSTSMSSVNMIRQGNMGIAVSSFGYSTSLENNTAFISVGDDKWLPENFGQSSLNTEFNIQDLPGTSTLQSFIFANRRPSYRGSKTTFTATATTFTDMKQTWVVNELTNAYVVVQDPTTGSTVETRKISSNTANVVTVSTAFAATTSNTTYLITAPVYLGSADFPWRRVYAGWDTDGGVRFGYGKSYDGTGVMQTGLLYMSSSDGSLNYRDPTGTINNLSSGAIPSGSISAYGGSSAPTGWMICNGNAISRSTYSALFTAIGTLWGTGDGSTTFNIPDLRSRTFGGYNSGDSDFSTMGSYIGENYHTLLTAEMPAHTHTQISNGSNNSGGGPAGIGNNTGPISTGIATSSTGGGGSHNTIQKTGVGNWIIKT